MSFDVVCCISGLPISEGDRAVMFSQIPGNPTCDLAAYRINGIQGPFIKGTYEDAGTLVDSAGVLRDGEDIHKTLYCHEMAFDTIVQDNSVSLSGLNKLMVPIAIEVAQAMLNDIKKSPFQIHFLAELKITEDASPQEAVKAFSNDTYYNYKRQFKERIGNKVWEALGEHDNEECRKGYDLARFLEKMPGTIGERLWGVLIDPDTNDKELNAAMKEAAFAYGADTIGASFEIRPTLLIDNRDKIENMVKITQEISSRKMSQASQENAMWS